MLTPREAFKVGFIARMVEAGIPLDQGAALVKQALDVIGPAVNMAKTVGTIGLVAPPAAGAIAGWGLGRGSDIDDTDVDEVKRRELIDEYARQTQRLVRERQARKYRQQRKQTGRVFL